MINLHLAASVTFYKDNGRLDCCVRWRSIMDYDILILGGGIIGCAVAYELSKYNLNISVIET